MRGRAGGEQADALRGEHRQGSHGRGGERVAEPDSETAIADRVAERVSSGDSHNVRRLLLYRVRFAPARLQLLLSPFGSGREREGAEGGVGAGLQRHAQEEAGIQVGQVSLLAWRVCFTNRM